jgi:hypothetical protein
MTLHNEIMNIQLDEQEQAELGRLGSEAGGAYLLGHARARHAAAELAYAREAELLSVLRRIDREARDQSVPAESRCYAIAQICNVESGETEALAKAIEEAKR